MPGILRHTANQMFVIEAHQYEISDCIPEMLFATYVLLRLIYKTSCSTITCALQTDNGATAAFPPSRRFGRSGSSSSCSPCLFAPAQVPNMTAYLTSVRACACIFGRRYDMIRRHDDASSSPRVSSCRENAAEQPCTNVRVALHNPILNIA